MAGKRLAVVALVALVALAGCSQDVTANVVPAVDHVSGTAEGPYNLTVTTTVETYTNATIAAVTLTGYDLNGDQLCTASVGDIAEASTTTLTCPSMPSVLVTGTPDRGREVGSDSDAAFGGGPQTVVTAATLYVGRMNESHRFVTYSHNLDRSAGFRYRNGSLDITESALREMRCRQRDALDSGANFSALSQPPWLNGTATTPSPTDAPTVTENATTPGQQDGTATGAVTTTERASHECW